MSKRSLAIAAAGESSDAADDNFKNVSLLLSGDGTNGSQNNTFLDSSTNNFTITRNGNTTQGTFSPYGSLWSNYFNGSTDYLKFTNANLSVTTQDFTAEAFICLNSYTNGSGGACNILASVSDNVTNNASVSWALYTSNGQVKFQVVYGSNYVDFGGATPPLGVWTHVAAVRSGSNLYLYVNGTRYSSSANVTLNAWNNIFIGGFVGNSSTYWQFPGYISNARFVKGTALYTASSITPPITNLTAVSGTQLLTCQNNRFVDNSSNAVTPSITGTPSVQRFSPFNPTAPYSASTIGGSGYFDGTGDYLSIANNAALRFNTGDFTVEAFVYLTSYTDSPTIVATGNYTNTSNNLYILRVLTSTQAINLGYGHISNWNNLNGTTVIKLNSWNHVAVTRSGTTVRLFVNGVQDASVTTSMDFNSTYPTTIGVSDQGTFGLSEYFPGYISNARILKGVAVYTSNFTPPTAPLTAITNTSLLLNFTNSGIYDNAMQNNLETVGNAQVSTSVKKYGTGSLYFDGSGDYLSIPSGSLFDMGTGNFTVEAWAYFNTVSGYQNLINRYFGEFGRRVFALYLNGNVPVFGIYDYANSNNQSGNKEAISSITVSTNTWYHLAGVRSGDNVYIFVNGTLAGTTTGASSFNVYGSEPLLIGSYPTGSAMNGYLDDVRITKGLARYTANFTPPTKALPTY